MVDAISRPGGGVDRIGGLGPSVGHRTVRDFCDWSESVGCHAGAARLLSLARDPSEPLLLGCLAAFIARADVLDLLTEWESVAECLSPVLALGRHISLSSDRRARLPSIDPAVPLLVALGKGLISASPLAALCGARNQLTDTSRRVQINCLRTWVLATALQYAETGNPADQHVDTVARHLRMAIEDPVDHHAKLNWFLQLRVEAQNVAAMSAEISVKCEKPLLDPARWRDGFVREITRAMRAVADKAERPRREFVGWSLPPFERTERANEFQFSLSPGPLAHTSPTDEDGELIGTKNESSRQTPYEGALAARGVLLEGVEDRQMLRFGWHRPTRDESDALRMLASDLLGSAVVEQQLLGAITVIAYVTGQSLETVSRIPLAPDDTGGWFLDVEGGTLRRSPARRAERWSVTDISRDWVRPLAQQWSIALGATVRQPLAEAHANAGLVPDIGGLWRSLTTKSLERTFNRACRQHTSLQRLSSGMIRRAAQQRLFDETGDGAFARLAASTPQSGLPGSCAYPSWSSAKTTPVWTRVLDPSWISAVDLGQPNENTLGSELDPDDQQLAAAIAALRWQLEGPLSGPSSWAERHNALTVYVLLALLGATGVRPVDSPFESPDRIDWEAGFAFVDDKVHGAAHAGRAVPLLPAVLRLISDVYLVHLGHLAKALASAAPELAGEVQRLSVRMGSKRLPFLFLLSSRPPRLDWMTVSESSLDALRLVDWPLPWNHLRHRLASRLRDERVDPEIIDGILGHGEAAGETWSDYSLRRWHADVAYAMPAIARGYEALNFATPNVNLDLAEVDASVIREDRPFEGRAPFGGRGRAARRQADHSRARASAKAQIKAVCAERPLSSLTKEELDALGRQMLRTEKGLPHPYAALRYAVFEEALQDAFEEEGRRPRLSKRHAALARSDSVFRADCIGARSLVTDVQAALRQLYERVPTGRGTIQLLTAIDLCVNSRVSNPKVLQSAARGMNLRLTVNAGSAWVEFRDRESEYPDQPAVRFPVTRQAAVWLESTIRSRALTETSPVPDALRPIAALLERDGTQVESSRQLLDALAVRVRQANVLELPGVVAAYLHGSVQSVGLPVPDWLRYLKGQAYRWHDAWTNARDEADDTGKGATDLSNDYMLAAPVAADLDRRSGLAKELVSRVRKLLSEYRSREPDCEVPSDARRDLGRTLKKLARNADPQTPPSMVMLVYWVVELLKERARSPRYLKPSSITRYLDALAPRLIAFAHDVDLAECGDDDIGDLYASMLVPMKDRENFDPSFVAARLVEFHRFAERKWGLETPDWSEIVAEGSPVGGAPGLILESEYLQALAEIVPEPAHAGRRELCSGMLLLLAYRFGLRGGEAFGLRRDDWQDSGATQVVLVRRKRRLKRPWSQRQVPLLTALTPHETELVSRWLATWDAIAMGNRDVPLFAMDQMGRRDSRRVLGAMAVNALRAVCRADHLTLHHARHGFAGEAFLALIPKDLVPQVASKRWLDPVHVQRLLLGACGETRRALWALARLLGHYHPRTSLASYVHVLAEVVQVLVARPIESWRMHGAALSVAEDLDRLAVDEAYLRTATQVRVYRQERTASLGDLLEAARLLAHGRTPAAVAFALDIDLDLVDRMRDWLDGANKRLIRTPRQSAGITDPHAKVERTEDRPVTRGGGRAPRRASIERQVLRDRWSTLIDIARDIRLHVSCIDAIAAQCQIGRSMQILMWRPEHFEWLGRFVDDLQLRSDVDVFETDSLDADVQEWAAAVQFVDRRRQRDSEGVRVFQVDGIEDGKPLHPVRHRCAVVRKAQSTRLRSNAELLLLWGAYVVASTGDSGGGVSTKGP